MSTIDNIKNQSQIWSWLDSSQSYQLLAGQVQSGKTREIINYCYWSVHEQKKSVLLVFQNISADVHQFRSRVASFHEQNAVSVADQLPIRDIRDYDPDTVGVYLAIGNFMQLRKFTESLDATPTQFTMCLDEADLCVKSGNNKSHLEKLLGPLKQRAAHILGVTATNLAILFHEQLVDSMMTLQVPDDYHSYADLTKVILPSSNADVARAAAYVSFTDRPSGFMLHIEAHKKQRQLMVAQVVAKQNPTVLFIVYNGNGTYVFPHAARSEILGGETDHPTACMKFPVKVGIQEILQRVSDSSITHLSLVSGRMAGRGVSFVSTDFKYHITDQLYMPNRQVHDEGMVQSLRILGRYQTRSELRLHTYKFVIRRMDSSYGICDKYNNELTNTPDRVADSVKSVRIVKMKPNFSRKMVTKYLKFKENSEDYMSFDGMGDIPEEVPKEDTKPPPTNNDVGTAEMDDVINSLAAIQF